MLTPVNQSDGGAPTGVAANIWENVDIIARNNTITVAGSGEIGQLCALRHQVAESGSLHEAEKHTRYG